VERCSILLLDEGAKVLRMGAASGIVETEWNSVIMNTGEGVAGRVVESKRPLYVKNAAQFDEFELKPHGKYSSQSFISVPIIHHEYDVLGVINATDKTSGSIMTERDLEILTAVSGFLGLIVYNNNLLMDFGALTIRLHNTLNSLPTGVLTVTSQHDVIDANKRALSLAGYNTESFARCPVSTIFSDEQSSQIITIVDKATQGNQSVSREIEWKSPDKKETFPLRIMANPFYLPESDETIAIVQMEDISVLRKIDELRQLEQMHNNFLSLVSHELRTPLTSIKGATHLLQSNAQSREDQTHLGLLGIISSNTERMIKMVNQLIDVAQLQQGTFLLNRQSCQIDGLLRQSICNFENLAENKQITLLTEFDESVPDLYIDPEKMLTAFNHLIDNAVKFTPMGGIIRILSEIENDSINVHFIDSGVGIDRNNWDKVFGKFFQIEDPMTRKIGGAGLGLYLTRAIVLLHHGSIDLIDTDEKGTHICLTIPVSTH
jgi:PAS domain S-box-containing protein